MFSHLKAHDVLHAEAVYGVLVVVVSGVTVSCIEVIVHQTVPNHDVVRVHQLVLLPQAEQSLV